MVLTGKLLQKLFVFKAPIEIIHTNCLIPDVFCCDGNFRWQGAGTSCKASTVERGCSG